MIWFTEILNSSGKWAPMLFYGERPTPTCHPPFLYTFRSDPELLPGYMERLSAQQVASILSPEGEFYGAGDRERIATYLRDPEAGMFHA